MASTKAGFLKHDFPVHGSLLFFQTSWFFQIARFGALADPDSNRARTETSKEEGEKVSLSGGMASASLLRHPKSHIVTGPHRF